MRPLSILIAVGSVAILCGCADPLEKRTSDEVTSQLQQGLTGGGRIGPEEREPGDPANEHGVPQTHP